MSMRELPIILYWLVTAARHGRSREPGMLRLKKHQCNLYEATQSTTRLPFKLASWNSIDYERESTYYSYNTGYEMAVCCIAKEGKIC